MFTGLTVKIVGFESASGKRLESASLVVQGPTRFGKRHTTDARWSADSVALTLDVHDAAFHGCGPLTVYICFFGLCWLTSRLSAGGNQVVPGNVETGEVDTGPTFNSPRIGEGPSPVQGYAGKLLHRT